MSRIMTVLKNKNKVERKAKQKRAENLNTLKTEAAYKSKLHEDLKLVDIVLSDETVKSTVIEVTNQNINLFMRAIYTEDMEQYSIVQLSETKFEIGRKIINF